MVGCRIPEPVKGTESLGDGGAGHQLRRHPEGIADGESLQRAQGTLTVGHSSDSSTWSTLVISMSGA